MREDNLLCLRQKPFVPYTTDSRHEFPIVANLTHGLVPTGLDQIWGRRHHLCPPMTRPVARSSAANRVARHIYKMY